MLPDDVEIISEETLTRIAHCIGVFSSAQKVLDDMERRRQDGQNPVAYWSRSAHNYFVTDAGR